MASYGEHNSSTNNKLPQIPLTAAAAKDLLNEILTVYTSPENIKKIEDYKKASKNDMTDYMRMVFPWSVQVQIPLIENYGYTPNGEGLIEFQKTIKELEKDHPDILKLNDTVKRCILPRMNFPID